MGLVWIAPIELTQQEGAADADWSEGGSAWIFQLCCILDFVTSRVANEAVWINSNGVNRYGQDPRSFEELFHGRRDRDEASGCRISGRTESIKRADVA